jgi:hypothetical protein
MLNIGVSHDGSQDSVTHTWDNLKDKWKRKNERINECSYVEQAYPIIVIQRKVSNHTNTGLGLDLSVRWMRTSLSTGLPASARDFTNTYTNT